jgi:CheY-like chemotaxis protein
MSCILVVDDDRMIRDVISDLLRDEGYDVQVAANGLQALALLEDHRPTAIILDMMMPVMDGWTFMQTYRQDTEHQDVPIVAMSAINNPRWDPVAEFGAQAFLRKPFDGGLLLDQIARLRATFTNGHATHPQAAP